MHDWPGSQVLYQKMDNAFRHLKLECALAIPASNE